jgi:hypothetical protein
VYNKRLFKAVVGLHIIVHGGGDGVAEPLVAD